MLYCHAPLRFISASVRSHRRGRTRDLAQLAPVAAATGCRRPGRARIEPARTLAGYKLVALCLGLWVGDSHCHSLIFGLLSSIRYNKNRGGMRLLKGEKGEVKAKENDTEHTIRGTYIN